MAMHNNPRLHQLYLIVILVAAKVAAQPMLDCPKTCGNLNIPYPFGTQEGCYLDHTFLINCTTPIPSLGKDKITVLNISLDNGELLVSSPILNDCNDSNNGNNHYHSSMDENNGVNLTNFPISQSKNKFTTIGCDTVGIFVGYDRNKNHVKTLGCVSMCSTFDEITNNINGSCDGIGCCQIEVPNGVYGFGMQTWSMNNHSTIREFNPCSYAFTVAEGYYKFERRNVKSFENNKRLPMVLDWVVGDKTCKEAQSLSSYACKDENSVCLDSTNSIGYRCKCHDGFHGNPYLDHGCKDIDECSMKPNPCSISKRCQNLHGSFKCSCPKGQEGDGLTNGKGCQAKKEKSIGNLILVIGLSLSLSLLALVVGCVNIYPQIRERKLIKMRENYFEKNGGLLLQQQIESHHGSTERATIFTVEELKKATNNYNEERIIGKGGHGTVFKGILSNGKVVAIKKSMVSNQSEIEQFINEVVVLSQINHRNVVKLLGCCLETEFPLLVYEFITNGTLFNHIHVEDQACHNNNSNSYKLSWTTRLRIAAETAEALAYLHSAVSTPIIHRDVKTANILLDDSLTAKVSDFGASKLVPLDQTQLTTLVQGTLGYLDPEYFQTSQLTEKSDVYSFGVVLAELLTSKKALSFLRPEFQRNLCMYFVSSMNEGGLDQILDNDIVSDANVEHIIEVANLAKRCLRLKGEERPSMKEVAMELEGIRVMEKHSLGGVNNVSEEESEYFLKLCSPTNTIDYGDGGSSSSKTTISRYYSMQNQILDSLGDGR
ncbi:hypothetical protein RJT34_23599 [Clitoria ternatea]|uniref:Uncharacterized protein n=1 Tax=Clitoria ternatea TaxID=43366 RepID=A0AAN9FLB6_CLITE